jgi:class 3 adenylate cyclase/tetratricopeptide (TPR) repeat protein
VSLPPAAPATELAQLRASIPSLEAQRAVLGDAVVDAAVNGLRQKIAALEAAAAPAVTAAPAETRRLITILFMDVVGSTTLAEKMDAEEWRQIVSRLMETVGAAVVRHHGRVAQYMGDGMLAFFGADQLREDDAENAIRAALAMQAEVAREFDPAGALPIRIRVGINSGPVVIGDLGAASHKEFTAIGDAMNTAARVQSEAPVGGVLISHDTYRHVRGVFDVTPRPPVVLKGKSQPVATYLVRRAKPRAFRSVSRGVSGIEAPTVGRTVELQTLQNAYFDAFEGCRVVWAHLRGQAGVGKSRLLSDMNSWLDLRPEVFRLFRARASEGDERQPFALIRWMWFDRFQIADDAPLAQAEAKWVQKFSELWGAASDDVTERAHALGLLAGLAFQGSPHLAALRGDPAQVKGRALFVARELLDRIRQTTPVVLQLEDMQWSDSSSCEALAQLLAPVTATEDRPAPACGLFVLSAARSEWTVPASLKDFLPAPPAAGTRAAAPAEPRAIQSVAVTLAPLSGEATAELVSELLQPLGAPPAELITLITDRAEGMPYYVEELVNWCCDHGIIDRSTEPWRFVPEKLRDSPLPVTLQHLLLTRLGALPEGERIALQRGAIFGRHFWSGGVQATGHEGHESLDGLRGRGFIEAQPESSFAGDTEWSFHHGLLRDVTYETVLKRDRAALHRQAATWLETQARSAGRLDEFTGLLGEHFERAGETLVAADWHLRAAERAKDRGAAPEAHRAFSRALELLPRTATDARWRALLGREETSAMLSNIESWQTDLAALQKLAESSGDGRRVAEVHSRAAEFHRQRGNFAEARRFADLAALTARGAGDLALEIKASATRATAEIRLGEIASGMRSAEEALAAARALGDPALLATVLARCGFCHAEGSKDQGRSVSLIREQAEIERRSGRAFATAVTQINLSVSLFRTGFLKQARAALEEALPIVTGFGARRARAYVFLNLGGVMLDTGELSRARGLLEQGLAEAVAVGDVFGQVGALAILGRTLERTGDLAGAARRLAEARILAEKMNAAPVLNDLMILQGQVALAQARPDEARALALRAWEHLKVQGGAGTHEGALAFVGCVEIFDALGEAELARAAATAGWTMLSETAGKIEDPATRQSLLENMPHNRALIEWCERLGVPMPAYPTS